MRHSTAPLYRRLVADAWRIAWDHMHLWVFGFFATVVGFGGVTESLARGSDKVYALLPGMIEGSAKAKEMPGLYTLRAIVEQSGGSGLMLAVSLLIMLGCTLVFAWLVYVAIGALVSGIRKIERGGDSDFQSGLKAGMERVWPVFGVNFWASLFVFVCFVLTASTLEDFLKNGAVWQGMAYIGVYATFALLTVAASIAAVLATCEVVIRKRGVREAIYAALDLLAEHWLVAFEMAVLLFFASLGIGLASLAIGAVVIAPFIFMMFLAQLAASAAAVTVVQILANVVMMVLVAVAGSLITTFQAASWALLWSEFEGGKPAAKLHRLARKYAPWLA